MNPEFVLAWSNASAQMYLKPLAAGCKVIVSCSVSVVPDPEVMKSDPVMLQVLFEAAAEDPNGTVVQLAVLSEPSETVLPIMSTDR